MADGFDFKFDELGKVDLIIDALYLSGNKGNVNDDPVNKIMGCGNQGGFRFLGNSARLKYKLAILYSSLDDPDWPDSLDSETGIFTYFGDNKTPGHELHSKKGNKLLSFVYSTIHKFEVDRTVVPPFFVFTKGIRNRDVIFRGLAAPGATGVPATDDLLAIWKNKNGLRFQNYKSVFTILDIPIISYKWIDELKNGNLLGKSCPDKWRLWIETGQYLPLKAPRAIEYRSKKEQLPANKQQSQLIKYLYDYFKDDPFYFENCAAELVRLMDSNIINCELTRRWADGGRDAIGKYRIGKTGNSITVDFAIEAKCYALEHSIKVEHTSRLISRLRHRQFGIMVTTSFVDSQAYKEIKEDEHPVIIISAKDIAEILTISGIGTKELLDQWLTINFPK